MKLQGKRVLLTGATGGIGRALASALAARGASLVLSGRSEVSLFSLQRILLQDGAPSVEIIAADLSAADGPESLAQRATQHGHALDLVIHCAGQAHCGAFESLDAAALESLWHTNVLAPMRLTRALLPSLRTQAGSRIVFVGSIFGSIAFPYYAAYSASKFALRGFAEALRRELDGSTVGITYVAPRYTRTAFNEGASSQLAGALKQGQDSPELVAQLIVRAIERDAADAYFGWPEKLFVRINALLPRLVDNSLRAQTRQMRAALPGLTSPTQTSSGV